MTNDALSITGFVLSLAGIFLYPLAIAGIIVSIIALVKKQERRGLAIAGIVIGAVVILVYILIFIGVAWSFAHYGSSNTI